MNQLKELWDGYIHLLTDPDNKVKIATWAATLTTFTFVITFLLKPFFFFVKKRFSKVRVEAGISQQIIASAFGTGADSPLLTCTITNRGDKTIFIHNPSIKLSEVVRGLKKFVVPKAPGIFPMQLVAGQQVTLDYNTIDLYRQVLRHMSPQSKVGFIVKTTRGEKYSSNKFTIDHITGHMDLANKMNMKK